MANSVIHLAITKKYIEKNHLVNYDDIIAGSLYPDATLDKDKSHYTSLDRGSDNISHIRGKVNLYNFLQEHNKLSDFELGWFLHLVTDYLFFEECFTTKYLKENTYEKFCKDLYFAYECLNLYIPQKYNITDSDYKAYPSEKYAGVPYEKCILDKDMIDDFIERVSEIDINKYIDKIKSAKRNIKP